MSFVERKHFSTLTGHNVLSNRASSFESSIHLAHRFKSRRLRRHMEYKLFYLQHTYYMKRIKNNQWIQGSH